MSQEPVNAFDESKAQVETVDVDSIPEEKKHWLYRQENRKTLWIIQGVILVLVMIPEFFVHHHPHFEDQGIHVDASWGFYAWYGFVTCAAMVFGAKLLGVFLKRKDTYYDD